MPLYDYACPSCGPFREWRSMSEYRQPGVCPECRGLAPRAVATPIVGMDAGQRRSHAINEKSAHEPRVVRRRRGDAIPQHDTHTDLMRVREERSLRRSEPRKTETHASHHPWMLRH